MVMTKYYSRSKGKFVDIATMPDQYVRNAFVKMCKTEPTEDVIFAQQQRERADNEFSRSMKLRNFLQEENESLEEKVKHYKKLAEDNFISGVDDLGEIEFLRYHNKVDIETINKNIHTMCNMADQITKLKKQLNSTTYQPYDKQGRARDYQVEYAKLAKERDKWKEKSMNMVEKSSYQVMWDNCQELQKKLDQEVRIDTQEGKVVELEETLKDTIKSNGELIQLNKQLKESLRQANLTPTVSTQAYDIAWQNIDELNDQVKSLLDRNAVLSRMYNASLSSNVTKGDSKMFSEIPNNPDGDMFICQLRQYLNKESYKIRVRGQYLKDEVKETEGWRRYEMGQPIEKSKCLRVYVDKK
jgi:hypothetical protein